MEKKKRKPIFIVAGLTIIISLISNQKLASYLFGEVQYQKVNLQSGNVEIPYERSIAWEKQSRFADSIYTIWAKKPIPNPRTDGKTAAPRIFLGKLLTKCDLSEVNSAILKLLPWGISGSTWALNKNGDYDFSLVVYTTILWFWGDSPEILFPDTKNHLLNVLLTEEGNKFRSTIPRSLGLIKETENHVLMTEGSRYLKNRWIMLHGNKEAIYNNESNGMEGKMLDLLEEMKRSGLYEFNSNPYIGYTITALLNLEAFASERVKLAARNVLDCLNWCYALGSYQLKHYPPMRRRYEKAHLQELTTDYHSVFMESWLSYSPDARYRTNISHGEGHALIGSCMPYRPADKVVEMIFNKENGYFVKLGHGPASCPEIYSAGKHFLLSAGGVNQGKRSLIIVRPITLFLNDSVDNLSGAFHLAGPGTDFMKWNNTGVSKNFACAAGPVMVPLNLKPISKNSNWSLYSVKDSICVAVYSTGNLGLMAIFEGRGDTGLLDAIVNKNPDPKKLNNQFQFPEGRKITYDVNAPKNRWVIISEEGQLLDRIFKKWPLIEGDFFK